LTGPSCSRRRARRSTFACSSSRRSGSSGSGALRPVARAWPRSPRGAPRTPARRPRDCWARTSACVTDSLVSLRRA
jgi:hypothetical protein